MAGCLHRQQAGPAQQQIYAAIPEPELIAVYPANSSGNAQPLATIKEPPPDKPVDVSVDLIGDVFVANENGNVRAFGGRNFRYEQIHVLEGPHTRIRHPSAIVTDFAGSFYVAEPAGPASKASVMWFPAGQNGNVFPNRVISGPRSGIVVPRGLALDGSGRLFVADQATSKVLVFDADATGDAPPVATLAGLKSPEHVFVDQLLNVYVSNRGDDSIAVFATSGPQSWTPTATIKSTAMRQPEGVAVDQTGRIAVSTTGRILFFAAGADGQAEPIAELRGPSPMNPAGIFIH